MEEGQRGKLEIATETGKLLVKQKTRLHINEYVEKPSKGGIMGRCSRGFGGRGASEMGVWAMGGWGTRGRGKK